MFVLLSLFFFKIKPVSTTFPSHTEQTEKLLFDACRWVQKIGLGLDGSKWGGKGGEELWEIWGTWH